MLPRAFPRSTATRMRASLATGLVAALTVTLLGALPSAPAYAANPVTPGNFTGLGFDQCEAPSQSAMSTWIKKSPFRAAGIYISGNSRACRGQKNLTPTWVRNQLAAGWRLLPITLGPQAACSHRYPRYGKNIDPTIIASSSGTYAAARSQGRAEANKAVSTAQRLGIVKGSTLFYDLEAFDTRKSTLCTNSALWFVHAWTNQLHRQGYASGFYSSAASGIKMLDDHRVAPNSPITMPDQVWIADWNGKANTSSSYIRSDGWQPYSRLKQYQGGHKETWGGVTINIDRNYLKLRTPKIPGAAAPAPSPAPAPTGPAYTGESTADPKCTPSTITRRDYPTVNHNASALYLVPLQCLLKQQRVYKYEVTGTWNTQTRNALHAFQARVSRPKSTTVTRPVWTSLLTRGNGRTLLKVGMKGADAVRVQRGMNAATASNLGVSGTYYPITSRAVSAYQRKVGLAVTGTVTAATWAALEAGRR